jgi:hypothetical protein
MGTMILVRKYRKQNATNCLLPEDPNSSHSGGTSKSVMNFFTNSTGSTPRLGGPERRKADRFPIERELRYKVLSKRSGNESGSGKTIDMSSHGISFTTEHALIPGKKIEMAISWPAQLDNRTALKMIARGRIVRCVQGQAAIEIQQYEFRTMGIHGLTI